MAARRLQELPSLKREPLDPQYLKAQLAKAGTPGPKRIGIDEISIKKRHTYRIAVSDLDRGRPVWFGGEDRSEASMARLYAALGQKKSRRIKLAPQAVQHDAERRACCLPGAEGSGGDDGDRGVEGAIRIGDGGDRVFGNGEQYFSHRQPDHQRRHHGSSSEPSW